MQRNAEAMAGIHVAVMSSEIDVAAQRPTEEAGLVLPPSVCLGTPLDTRQGIPHIWLNFLIDSVPR